MEQQNTNPIADFNSLTYLLKSFQQNHLTLVQYIKKISNQTQQDILMDQQLKPYLIFFNNLLKKETSINNKIQQMKQRLIQHKSILSSEEQKFMNKIIQKTMQIFQSSCQKFIIWQEFYEFQFKCLKSQLIKIPLDQEYVSILTQKVVNYSKQKYLNDKELLHKMINMIETGQRENIKNQLEQYRSLKQQKINKYNQQIKNKKEQQLKSLMQIQQQQLKQKIRIQQKLKTIKENQKNLTKNQKRINRFSENILSKLYLPLAQFSKQQFEQDMLFLDVFQQKDKLYKQIKARNRLIEKQISSFIQYYQDIEEKIITLSPRIRQYSNTLKSTIKQQLSVNKTPLINNTNKQKQQAQITSQLNLTKQTRKTRTTINRRNSDDLNLLSEKSTQKIVINRNVTYKNSICSVKQNQTKVIKKYSTLKPNPQCIRNNYFKDNLPQIMNLQQRKSFQTNRHKIVYINQSHCKTIQIKHGKRQQTSCQIFMPSIQMNFQNRLTSNKLQFRQTQQAFSLKKLLKI